MEIIIQGSEPERDAIGSRLLEIDEVDEDMIRYQDGDSSGIGLSGGTDEERAELSEKVMNAVNSSAFLSAKLKED